jgi:hypothetical protein
VDRLKIHPICEAMPEMQGNEWHALHDDIAANGQLEPIFVFEEMILDGRHRYEICRVLGIKPWIVSFDGDDPIAFVVSKNLCRRNLKPHQRAMTAARLANLRRGGAGGWQVSSDTPIGVSTPISQTEAAKALGASPRSVSRAAKVLRDGTRRLVSVVDEGRMSLDLAARVSGLPDDEQNVIAYLTPEEIAEYRRVGEPKHTIWEHPRLGVETQEVLEPEIITPRVLIPEVLPPKDRISEDETRAVHELQRIWLEMPREEQEGFLRLLEPWHRASPNERRRFLDWTTTDAATSSPTASEDDNE